MQNWAEVTLDDLPSEDRSDGSKGERRIRLCCNYSRVNYTDFDILQFTVSQWVLGRRPLNLNEYQTCLHRCWDLVEKHKRPWPKRQQLQVQLFISLIGLPPEMIVQRPDLFRKEVVNLNKIYGFLLNPRSVGSVRWKLLDQVAPYYVIRILPPLTKYDFVERVRIAVGYRDKGHCRNLAVDGSPHHWEVAMAENLKHSKDIRVRITSLDRFLCLSPAQVRLNQLKRYRKRRREEFSLLI